MSRSRRREKTIGAASEGAATPLSLREDLRELRRISEAMLNASLNPVSSIQGAAEMLADTAIPEQTRRELIAIIRQECRCLSHSMVGLFRFAKPRPPECVEADLAPMLDRVIRDARSGPDGRSISVRKELPEPFPLLYCDAELLEEALLQLLFNAFQATPRGGEVVLSARAEDDGILLEVRDSGHGVAEQDLPRMFEPFFSTRQGHSGLGLAIAQDIVSQHGGKIVGKQNTGQGMTFSVWLPLSQRTINGIRQGAGGGG